MYRTPRVLLTGASGFIGSNVLNYLIEKGYPTTLAFRKSTDFKVSNGEIARIEKLRMDCPEDWRAIVDDVELVLHVAGATSGTCAQLIQANRNVTDALMKACADCQNPPTVVFISSLSAAGPSQKGSPRSIHDPPNPVSAYGRSKLQGELAALRYADVVPLTILRPGIVFGPGDKELIRLLKPISKVGLNPIAGRHDPRISFIHVSDLIQAIFSAAERGARCNAKVVDGSCGDGRYFVADDEQITFSQFAVYVSRGLSVSRVRDVRLPLSLVRKAALISEYGCRMLGKRSTFTTDKISEAAATSWECDVRVTVDELNWRPSQSLAGRLEEFALHWKTASSNKPRMYRPGGKRDRSTNGLGSSQST